jgi:hypothetical protein
VQPSQRRGDLPVRQTLTNELRHFVLARQQIPHIGYLTTTSMI